VQAPSTTQEIALILVATSLGLVVITLFISGSQDRNVINLLITNLFNVFYVINLLIINLFLRRTLPHYHTTTLLHCYTRLLHYYTTTTTLLMAKTIPLAMQRWQLHSRFIDDRVQERLTVARCPGGILERSTR
jgi:hypothetical protein